MNNVMESAIVLGIIVLIIALPIYIINQKTKAKRKKALEEKVQDLIREHALSINKADFFDHKYLGLDENRKVLLFIRSLPQLTAQVIDVKPISDVRIEQKSQERILRFINLNLVSPGGNVTSVPIYESNTDNEARLKNFHSVAERWKGNLSVLMS